MSDVASNDISQALKPILALHQAGALEEALVGYSRLLETHPKHPVILSNMGTICAQQGQLTQAVALFKRTLLEDSAHIATLNNLAGVLHLLDQFEEAESYYLQAIKLRSTKIGTIKNLAGLYLQTRRFEEAHSLYKKAISQAPKLAELYYFDGLALKHLGRVSHSILRFKTAIKLDPTMLEALKECGVLLHAQQKYAEATQLFSQAIALYPDQALFYFYLGLMAQQAEQYEQALTYFDKATTLDAKYAEAFNNRGMVLCALKRHDEAMHSFDMAIYLDPKLASAYNNRGTTLHFKNRFDEAIVCFDKAISLQPRERATHNNKGLACLELADYDEATIAFEMALKQDPNYVQAKFNLGMLKLRLGDYAQGWPLYEARWEVSCKQEKMMVDVPLWLGEDDLINQTLLLHTEQTLGDTIQFSRYVPLLKQFKLNQIVVEVPDTLFALLHHTWANDPQISVIKTGQRRPHIDRYCPIKSLPLAFKTLIDTIPHVNQYLVPEDKLVKQWQHQLGAGQTKRIGIAWGDCLHPSNDGQHSNDAHNNIQLESLAPLFDLNLDWHCLQNELCSIERFTLRKFPHIAQHQQALTDLSETAALIMQLDLVISMDSAVAHLAAALGKPVWLLLPFNADFIWLTERQDSPWYPSVTLFRQTEKGEYTSVIEAVKSRLVRDLATPGVTFMPTAA